MTSSQRRLLQIFAFLAAWALVVVARLAQVQLVHHDEYRRTYPKGSLAANVVGYVGVDGHGLAGIEHGFEGLVRGRAGKVTLLRDARRGMYFVGGEGPNKPVDGGDVVLTIDAVVQFI